MNKAQMKECAILFVNNAFRRIIRDKLFGENCTEEGGEQQMYFEEDGWYYSMKKNNAVIQPEFVVYGQNYHRGRTEYYKYQPKGHRINEEAWIYKEVMNRKSGQIVVDGYSIQDYKKTAF
jgi:hypothetical protein